MDPKSKEVEVDADKDKKDDEILADEELQIEIVDDTPPEDRGRGEMPKEIVEELEKDDLEAYSDKVKLRLSQMKRVYHDERRAKERENREKEEAVRFAQATFEENKALKKRLGEGEKLFIEEISKATTSEVGAAKDKLKQAYESGDAGAIADAQEALTDAKIKLREYQKYRPTTVQEDDSGVEQPQRTPPNQVTVDPKADKWRGKNTWFGSDEEMTALALGLHEKLVKSGVDPRSDNYYATIDKTMRKRFPENFEEEQTETQDKESEKPTPSTRRAASVVAPATRSTAPKQVRLTPTQIALAKRLGLTNEAYAREVIKLENAQNG